jgi:hypothetical protein
MLNKHCFLISALTLSLVLSSFARDRLGLLPPTLQVRMRVSSTTEFLNRLKKSPAGQLWADPQFQTFASNAVQQTCSDLFFSEASKAEKQISMDQFKMLKGELVLGFDLDSEQYYVAATMSPEDYQRSLEQGEQLKEAATDPFEIINDEFQGIRLIRHIQNGGTEEESSTLQAHVANTMLLSPDREWLERSIIQLKKEPPPEPGGSPTLNVALRMSRLIQKLAQEMKSGKPTAPNAMSPETVLGALGLTGVENCIYTLRLDEDKMVSDSTLTSSDWSKGLFSLLDTQASSLPTVTFIPENISSLEVGRINLLGLWREVPNIATAISPSGRMQFDMMSAMIQQQAQVDIDQNLLSNLDTRYLSFSVTDPETTRQVSIAGIELKDSFAFKTALETALAAPALQPQVAALLDQEAFLDHTIYTVKNRQEGSEPVAFCVAADRFFYGPPKAIRQVIRTQNSADSAHTGFEQSPLVRGLRQHTPANAFGYRAIDWEKQMESILKEVTNPAIIAAFKKGFESSGKQKITLPDLNKLPPADHLASFFNVSYQYTEQTGNKLHQRVTTEY